MTARYRNPLVMILLPAIIVMQERSLPQRARCMLILRRIRESGQRSLWPKGHSRPARKLLVCNDVVSRLRAPNYEGASVAVARLPAARTEGCGRPAKHLLCASVVDGRWAHQGLPQYPRNRTRRPAVGATAVCHLQTLAVQQKAPAYSITSSARSRNASGIVSALAVVRVITRSNFAGCSTWSSPGFSPRTMRHRR